MYKLDLFAGLQLSIFGLLLFLGFFLGLISPVSCCYKNARYAMLKTLGHGIIAPFGLVRFRHFFLADVLTSLVKPLVDVRYCFCFFIFTKAWLEDDPSICTDPNSIW